MFLDFMATRVRHKVSTCKLPSSLESFKRPNLAPKTQDKPSPRAAFGPAVTLNIDSSVLTVRQKETDQRCPADVMRQDKLSEFTSTFSDWKDIMIDSTDINEKCGLCLDTEGNRTSTLKLGQELLQSFTLRPVVSCQILVDESQDL